MTADLTNLKDFLDSGKQFRIPLYQRPYGWGENLCQSLIYDNDRNN